MHSKADSDHADAPPPYDDTRTSPRNSDSKGASEQPPLTIAATRTLRIQNTVHHTLAPLISTQISTCTAKALYILIPEGALLQHPHPKDVANIPTSLSAHQLTIVSPPSPSTTTSTNPDFFWQQPVVADILTSALRTHLTHFGDNIEQKFDPSISISSPSPPDAPRRPSFMSRIFSDDPHAPSRHFKTGWRSADEEPGPNSHKPLARDQIRVLASVRDISVNVETPLGLWDTSTFPAMWIVVEIGT